jgi:lysophospholipase L1-like esterase
MLGRLYTVVQVAVISGRRRSPVEIVATIGVRSGRFGQWADGVTALRADCVRFAEYWQAHNESVLAGDGPLWVALGDSTAQGLGAAAPLGGYVGQALGQLRRVSGQPWRVLNLSVSGALIRDVLGDQLPAIGVTPDLVTCGIGINDIFYSSPRRLFAELRVLPRPAGIWGPVGMASMPYVSRINRVLHEGASARGLPVAMVSRTFTPPWAGRLAGDKFHPNQQGHADWARAVLAAIPAAA